MLTSNIEPDEPKEEKPKDKESKESPQVEQNTESEPTPQSNEVEQVEQEQESQKPQEEPTNNEANTANTIEMNYVARVVAACESGKRKGSGTAVLDTHNWTAENPNSTASGAYQFLDGTWLRIGHNQLGYTQYHRAKHAPPQVQTHAFYALWNNGRGSSHWNASRSCWGPMLN